MKKFLCLFLFALIMHSHCQDDDGIKCYKDGASGVEECEKLNAGEGHHCCFIKYEYNDVTETECDSLSNAQYDDIKDYISKMEDESEEDVEIDIDCSSNYITISLLLFLLFL